MSQDVSKDVIDVPTSGETASTLPPEFFTHPMPDRNATYAEIRETCPVRAINHPEGADAYIVAEIWHERPEALTGDQYDATMDYPLLGAILSFTGAGRLDWRVVGQHHTIAALVRDDDARSFAARLDRALTV